MNKPRVFDMFAGGGGIRLGVERAGFKVVAYCEIDKHAKAFYNNVFDTSEEVYFKNAVEIDTNKLPEFELLCAGFPCQPFSNAGQKRGFDDVRGTLFFEVARILRDRRPRCFLCENVKGLLSHDGGKTFKTILKVLTDLGYRVEWAVLNSKDFGVPQNRERIYIVGFLRIKCCGRVFPLGQDDGLDYGTETGKKEVYNIASTLKARDYQSWNGNFVVGSLRTHKADGGFRPMKNNISPALLARAREDGSCLPAICMPVLTPNRKITRQNGRRYKTSNESMFTLTAQDRHGVILKNPENWHGSRGQPSKLTIRRLTPLECFRLQAFPDEIFYKGCVGISDAQLYKIAGNSVTVNVVYEIAKRIREILNEYDIKKRED